MSVFCLIAGGLERNDGGIRGIRTVIGDNGLDSPRDTTVNAPVAGLRGVRSAAGTVGGACYIPSQTPGTDCPAFPANGRTWLAVHSEVIPECTASATNNATYALFKLYMTDFNAVHRDLQLLMVNGFTRFITNAPTTTYTATSVKDTTTNFVASGSVVGDFIMATGGVMVVTSFSTGTNPNDTANGTWHMADGTTKPADGLNASVRPPANVNYKWRITDGTTNWDSTARASSVGNTTPLVIDFQWQPGLTAGTNTMQLTVNGVLEISQTGGTVVPAPPGVLACVVWIGADDVAKGNVWPDYVEWYNTIFYDDISQPPFSTYPIAYDPLIANRPLVTFRPPLRLGSHKYTAWTPSTGADVSAVIDDHPTIDQTTYAISTLTGDMESWQCKDLTACDYPLTSADQVYAVQSIGNCNVGVAGKISMGHTNGSTLDDAGRMVRGTTGVGQMLWCASKDPGGQPWTYTTANQCQTWVKDVLHEATSLVYVFDAGQLILFRRNAAGEVPVVDTSTVGTYADASVI